MQASVSVKSAAFKAAISVLKEPFDSARAIKLSFLAVVGAAVGMAVGRSRVSTLVGALGIVLLGVILLGMVSLGIVLGMLLPGPSMLPAAGGLPAGAAGTCALLPLTGLDSSFGPGVAGKVSPGTVGMLDGIADGAPAADPQLIKLAAARLP